jgi:hypothetical protein
MDIRDGLAVIELNNVSLQCAGCVHQSAWCYEDET